MAGSKLTGYQSSIARMSFETLTSKVAKRSLSATGRRSCTGHHRHHKVAILIHGTDNVLPRLAYLYVYSYDVRDNLRSWFGRLDGEVVLFHLSKLSLGLYSRIHRRLLP